MKNNVLKNVESSLLNIMESKNSYIRLGFIAVVFFAILIPIYNLGKVDGKKIDVYSSQNK